MSESQTSFSLKTMFPGGASAASDAGAQRPKQNLILLPGLMCDDMVWQEQVDSLSDIAQCFCADWGHLDSFQAMAESVLRAAPDRFALAGHSMGGRVSFQICRLAPERVTRLGLFNTGCEARATGATGEEEARKRLELLDTARGEGMRAMALKWLPPMIAPERIADSVLVESIVGMIGRKTPEIFQAQIRALLERPDATPALSLIRCPTLLISGREDGWSPPDRHAQMAQRIRDSRLVVIAHCGHMSTLEQPAEVSREMRAWLLDR
jgi:pimeloyl-ACP methyl ester carboxylesterase